MTEQKCWCRTCRPITLTDMRFVVCPECGSKRCPRAGSCKEPCIGPQESPPEALQESKWIPVGHYLPLTIEEAKWPYDSIEVLVTDGVNVCLCEFQVGKTIPARYWAAFSAYSDIQPQHITHWQYKPLPPT